MTINDQNIPRVFGNKTAPGSGILTCHRNGTVLRDTVHLLSGLTNNSVSSVCFLIPVKILVWLVSSGELDL